METRIRLVGLGVLLLAVVVVAGSVSAASTPIEMQLARLGLGVVEEAPAGVVPLEFGSLGELRNFLRGMGQGGILLTEELRLGQPLAGNVESTSASISTTIDIRSLHYSYICNTLWRTRFNLWADVYVAVSGSFHWIDEVRNVRVGLSGLHPFMRLVDTYEDVYLYPDQQKVRIEGGGTLEYYLILGGFLVYYSDPAYMIVYYSI